jgi:hypothetical protein
MDCSVSHTPLTQVLPALRNLHEVLDEDCLCNPLHVKGESRPRSLGRWCRAAGEDRQMSALSVVRGVEKVGISPCPDHKVGSRLWH